MKLKYTITVGHYNWADPTEKQLLIEMQLWPEDEKTFWKVSTSHSAGQRDHWEEKFEDDLVSAAKDAILAHMKHYMISNDRRTMFDIFYEKLEENKRLIYINDVKARLEKINEERTRLERLERVHKDALKHLNTHINCPNCDTINLEMDENGHCANCGYIPNIEEGR